MGPWALAAAVALVAGCQNDNTGDPCLLNVSGTVADGGACDTTTGTTSADTADYFDSNPASICDSLICIHSARAGQGCSPADGGSVLNGRCSKPCISDSDCNGLVCRQVVLDKQFIDSLPDGGQIYLGGIPSSNFCAAPPPP